MKKLVFTLVIALVIIIGSIAIFYGGFQNKNENLVEAIQATPTNASFILKINDYHKLSSSLNTNNRFWEALKPFTTVAKVDSLLSFIDTLASRFEVFNRLLTVNPVYISTHTQPNGKVQILSAVKIPHGYGERDIMRMVEQFTTNRYRITTLDYQNLAITTIVDSSSSMEKFSFAYFKGLIICSPARSMVETSIAQLQSHKSLLNDPSFVAISHTAGDKVEANLYLNNRKIPVTFQHLLKLPYSTGINTFEDIANWSELDITVKEDAFSFNGFTQAPDSSNSFLKVLARQTPVENKISTVLPSETAFFVSLGLSNIDNYLEDYRSYLDQKGRLADYTNALNETKKLLGVDIHELYRSFFNKEIALFFASFDGVDPKDCWFVAIRNNGLSQTKLSFNSALDFYQKHNKQSRFDFKSTFKIDKVKSYDIYKLPIIGINKILFGSLFSEVSDEYFTFIDDFIVFGASKEALSKVILSNIRNKQLHLDVSFRQFSNALTSESNYFVYINPGRTEKLYSQVFEESASAYLSENHAVLSKIQGIALQINGGNSMLFNNICFQYSPYTTEDPLTNWETRLDTVFTMRPQYVVNHFTRSQEIIVQDAKNTLYLLNEVGRVLWKKRLNEPINGEITQVDLLKNNKLQYLLSTPNYIHAIDRKGEYVSGFPIKLKAKATNSVSVFDYDKNREYRFLIACDDRKVYAFNKQGKPITGWFFRKTEKIVTKPIQLFQAKGKDYIVFADANRPYILDRKGEERVVFTKFFSRSKLNSFVFDAGDKSHSDRLVTTDSVGLIKYVYLNGKVEDLAVKAFSAKHVFDYLDVDSDGAYEFIFLDSGRLYVYKQNKSLFFLYKFDAEIFPQILNFSVSKTDQKLGFVSSSKNEVYLINGNGSLYQGFPLKGSTPFSITNVTAKGANFSLITGSPSGLLLNYSVK